MYYIQGIPGVERKGAIPFDAAVRVASLSKGFRVEFHVFKRQPAMIICEVCEKHGDVVKFPSVC